MPVCTGTDLALSGLDDEDGFAFRSADDRLRRQHERIGNFAQPEGHLRKGAGAERMVRVGRSISTSRLRVEGSSARVERVTVPVNDRPASSVTFTVALVFPGTTQG